MISINNKKWNDLVASDIYQFIYNNDESFFIEYKNDSISNRKLCNETSAFANTYGGYVILYD